MRLIDADKFAEKFTGQYEFMKKVIDEQPTVDAVEVVRCKDCVSYGITTNNGKPRSYMCGSCLPNDFCSNGWSKYDE